jgi:hypothetical protein
MAIDSSASQVATNALQAIPFGSIIGGPLTACVEAQAMAAETTWEFIQKVGLQTDDKGNKKAVNVQFEYVQGGRRMMLNIPLLTIVPIPYIAINEIDIAFKASISASSSSVNQVSKSTSVDAGVSASAHMGFGFYRASVNMHANFSSKKDSKATQESKYSVEYTMDVHVHAGQDSMPAGMARILELLNNTVETVNSKGELSVSDNVMYISLGSEAIIIATYKTPEGVFDPKFIEIYKDDNKTAVAKSDSDSNHMLTVNDSGENMICRFAQTGSYYIRAGECKALVVINKK